MSIYFITGKPRAGKSLYSVALLVRELVHGTRPVVTNLALDLGALNEYLQREYPSKSVDLHRRVRILTDEETRSFWLYGPSGPPLQDLSNEQWKRGEILDFSPIIAQAPDGIFYAIDEIHTVLNARNWMNKGLSCTYWASQHAKMSQDVLAITQVISNVDKQFRELSQNYTVVKNLAKQRLGIFKMPGIFVRQTFSQVPNGNSTAEETGTFRLDTRGLASCYFTAKGVGIHGSLNADKNEKRRGLPMWWIAVGLAVILFAILRAPTLLASFFNRTNKPAVVAPAVPVQVPQGAPTRTIHEPKTPANFRSKNSQITEENAKTALPPEEPEPVYMSCLVNTGTSYIVGLSDGRTFSQDEVTAIGKEGCIIKGVTYKFRDGRYIPREQQKKPEVFAQGVEYSPGEITQFEPKYKVRVARAVVWDAEKRQERN